MMSETLPVFFFESQVLNFLTVIQNLKLWLFGFSKTFCLHVYEELKVKRTHFKVHGISKRNKADIHCEVIAS